MPSDRHDDGQLSLDFEQPVEVKQDQTRKSSLVHEVCAKPVMTHLQLVVCNSGPRRLLPNSVEVTRMLAEQARELRW